MGFAFKLDITGNMAAQLAPISKGLQQTDQALGTAARSASMFDRALEGVAKQTKPLLTFDLGSMLRAGADAATTAARAVWDLGKRIVETSAKAQDLNLAARLQLGEEGAAALQRVADSFSNTRFDDDAIKQALLPLANAGIRDEKMLDDIATAAADISARFNSGEAGFNAATDALGKIALKREVGARQLEALGLNEGDYFRTLAGMLGTSIERVKKQVAAGKIAAPTLLSVALQGIAEKQGGELGVAALAGGKTLGATLQRLSDLPDNLFKQLADSPGMAAIQRTLDNIINVVSGPKGEEAINRIGGAIERAFGKLTGDDIVNGVERVIETVEALTTLVVALGKIIDEAIVKPLTFAGKALGETSGRGFMVGEKLGEGNFVGAGQQAVAGFAEGTGDALSTIAAPIRAVAQFAEDTLRDALDTHSPSRLFAAIGADTTAGLASGMVQGLGAVEDASRSLVAAATPGSIGAPGVGPMGAAVGGIVIYQTNEYQIDGARDDEAIVRLIEERQEVANARLLRSLAIEQGAEV